MLDGFLQVAHGGLRIVLPGEQPQVIVRGRLSQADGRGAFQFLGGLLLLSLRLRVDRLTQVQQDAGLFGLLQRQVARPAGERADAAAAALPGLTLIGLRKEHRGQFGHGRLARFLDRVGRLRRFFGFLELMGRFGRDRAGAAAAGFGRARQRLLVAQQGQRVAQLGVLRLRLVQVLDDLVDLGFIARGLQQAGHRQVFGDGFVFAAQFIQYHRQARTRVHVFGLQRDGLLQVGNRLIGVAQVEMQIGSGHPHLHSLGDASLQLVEARHFVQRAGIVGI